MPSFKQNPGSIFDQVYRSTGDILNSGLNGAANTVGGLYNSFHDAAEQTGVPQAIGGAVGAAGGAIGGAVGGLGNFFSQSLQGKGLDPRLMGQDIANTARSTANFGYQTGKEGAIAAPMSNAGKIVSGAMSVPPIRDVVSDVRSGNVNLGTGLKAGAAAASLYGAAKSPNWTPGGVLDPQLKALAAKIKDNVGIPGAGSMQETGRYNGYKNWDTWNKNLWLNNDEPQYRQMQSILKNAKSLEEGAQMLKRNFSDAFDDGIDKSKVDWMEIAKVNMEDMLPTGSVNSGRTAKQLQNFQNSMDDGIDTSSNYGENLMNNDGGASPSVMKAKQMRGNFFGGYQQGEINAPDLSKTPKVPNPFPGEFGQQQDIRASSNDIPVDGPQPGKWNEAYSRPMGIGYGLESPGGNPLGGNVTLKDSPANRAIMEGQLPRGKGMASYPLLTPAQQGVVTKLLKQVNALKGKAK